MKRCPTCNRTYTDLSLNFCLEDGTPLLSGPPAPDPNATVRYPPPRDTSEPPPTEIYRPEPAIVSPRPPTPPPSPQQWSPTPTTAPPKKSNAVWWILGGLAAVLVIGVGLVVMLIALASLGANTNNSNVNANVRNENRNSNVAVNANVPNVNASSNANSTTPAASLSDDFSEKKWGTGTSQYGRIWYDNGEYHMSSKEKFFVVMYAPSDDYSTENSTVKVNARSVDGNVPGSGFGLMVLCQLTKTKQLQDYALLIYPSAEPEYEIIMHKDGNQSALVSRTKSSAIHSGSARNQLEIRIKGGDLFFYANGQYLTRVNDSGNFKRGVAGFYTSDVYEVAFDNLEIQRSTP